jgi:outer membrane protein
MKKQKEDEILKKEKEAKELQKKRFGKDGDLFKKRQELVKPIQDKVYNAIEDVATKKSYSFVFDKAANVSILYADPKLDISDEILTKVGGLVKESK